MDFIAVYRMRIGLYYGRHNKIKGLDYLTPFESLIILSLLLLKSGDIETNPGPDTDSLSSSSSTPTQFEELMIKNKFSVVHCNVQSLASKIEAIEPELSNFDVICLTETWLDHRTSDDLVVLAYIVGIEEGMLTVAFVSMLRMNCIHGAEMILKWQM